jgi:hypothetical protein
MVCVCFASTLGNFRWTAGNPLPHHFSMSVFDFIKEIPHVPWNINLNGMGNG